MRASKDAIRVSAQNVEQLEIKIGKAKRVIGKYKQTLQEKEEEILNLAANAQDSQGEVAALQAFLVEQGWYCVCVD